MVPSEQNNLNSSNIKGISFSDSLINIGTNFDTTKDNFLRTMEIHFNLVSTDFLSTSWSFFTTPFFSFFPVPLEFVPSFSLALPISVLVSMISVRAYRFLALMLYYLSPSAFHASPKSQSGFPCHMPGFCGREFWEM